MSDVPPGATVTVRFSKATSPRFGLMVIEAARRLGTRAPREVHAVVVESEPGYRRGVPPVQVEPLPIRVDGQRLEVTPVSYQVALYLADAAGSQGVCQLTQPREGILSQTPAAVVSVA